jgi:NAD(P)-dependent dehydrogenase (short-subunit alcohol dehydrogenase family)
VSGAAGTIGAAIVQALADAGAAVIAADISTGPAWTAPGTATSPITGVHLDVTSADSWAGVAEQAAATYGIIEILVNCAGVRPASADVVDIDLGDWRRAFEINATGTLLGCKTVLPAMIEKGAGKIVNIASTVAKVSPAGSAAYAASKHAVIALTQSLSQEAGQKNINVNAICPGPVASPLLFGDLDIESRQALHARLAGLSPMGRIASPEDVASLALFLVSRQARTIHGQAISIDGGRIPG